MTLRNVYCATLGEKSGHKTVCTTRPHDSYLRVYVCVCDRKSVVLARTTLEWKKSFSRPFFRVYVNVPKPLLSKGKVSGTDSPQHLLQTIHLSLTGILAGPGDGQTHTRPCWHSLPHTLSLVPGDTRPGSPTVEGSSAPTMTGPSSPMWEPCRWRCRPFYLPAPCPDTYT